jgi:hypothetical protein
VAFAEPLAALAAFAALPFFFMATVVRPLRHDPEPAQTTG